MRSENGAGRQQPLQKQAPASSMRIKCERLLAQNRCRVAIQSGTVQPVEYQLYEPVCIHHVVILHPHPPHEPAFWREVRFDTD